MGHGLSCSRDGDEHDFFRAAQVGDLDALLAADPALAHRTTIYDRLSVLHVAAANGQLQVLSMFLDRGAHPDVLNRNKLTPLMLAAMHGKIDCVLRLLEAGANILMFDSVHARTCLHQAAYYGHADCLQAVLSAAQATPVAGSWGFARFVNVRDEHGATPLHLAARQGRPECVHLLLEKGAIVSAATVSYGFPGSTALHLAARGGSLDCIRELLAWGGDRLQRDSAGRIAYAVALKRRHGACAALLNPAAAEPMVWPSPLKFISELDPEAKALLEAALVEANREREKRILKGTKYNRPPSPPAHEEEEEEEEELCSICFEQACSIEVQECGHQMCAPCTLALCCHSKPNPTTLALQPPACPFCRSSITRLLVAVAKTSTSEHDSSKDDARRRSRRSEGSSSFEGLMGMRPLSNKMARGRASGRLPAHSFKDLILMDKQAST
ncbi:E3 ubiquitin-protein ligase XB3-like [Phragmites australis]|uniref:E3 ubiquitin-protein ligase XB3-like n=1 Tax=Phragmites australis TaxID=29695 RepID=UPI002D76E4B1|nr:E3 ubiquitin-protein ligase XB3-like [Phragmites australis]